MSKNKDETSMSSTPRKAATLVTHGGRHPKEFHGFINPPLVRASTVLFNDVDEMKGRRESRYAYGLMNTPTIEAFNEVWTELEEASGTVLVPSGLAAVTVAILSALSAGEEILVPDNVYGPTRRFCNQTLKLWGMRTSYYDPMDLEALKSALDGGASAVFVEAPGSLTFEVPDIGAKLELAKAAGAITMIDNTWATPLLYKPIAEGFDLSIQAGTKYVGGHADVLIGSISANERMWPKLSATHANLGIQAGPDEIYLAMRGLRTMKLRMDQHEGQALEVAKWLRDQPKVARLLHPAMESCPGHDNWKRYFGRSSGLFAFELAGTEDEAATFLNALRLFGLGFSWGGFESLATLAELRETRSVTTWQAGPVIRLQIGLEAVEDQIADLEQALAAIAA